MIVTLDDALAAMPESQNPNWVRGLIKEFERGWELEKAQQKARALEARREVDATPLKTVDGLGQLKAVFDARTYFRWLEEDEHFWDDDSNVNKFLKDNPEYKAPKPVAKPTILI